MGMKSKYDKLMRWAKIWVAQFGAVKNRRCEQGSNAVLIIKLDAIGDFLIWLDSAKEFRKLYPDKRLVLLCNTLNVEIAEATGYFDSIKSLNIKKFESDSSYRKSQLEKLSEEQYDLIIQTVYSRTIHMDIIAAAVPAYSKVGLQADESRSDLSRYITFKANRKKFDRVYDTLYPVSTDWLMEVKRNGELIRALGYTDFQTGIPFFNETDAKEKIPEGDYYVLFPGSSSVKKMWNTERFAGVADYIYKKTGWVGYVCGGMDEKHLYADLMAAKQPETKVVDYFGRTTLLELAEVIRHAKLVVSNDTSGIHFAAVTDTPAVCISGEYHFGRFLPYDCDKEFNDSHSPMYICHADMPCKRCVNGKITKECSSCVDRTGRYLCIDKITVEQVNAMIDKILKN